MYEFAAQAFEDLLIKAMAPVEQPTEEDHAICQKKRHYNGRHEAEQVVQRTIMQNPHMSRNLHSYICPSCFHTQGKKQFIVGHKPIGSRPTVGKV